MKYLRLWFFISPCKYIIRPALETGTDYAMVIGGYNNLMLSDVEIADFSNLENSTLVKPSNLPEQIEGAVAEFINGSVVTCGGFGISTCYSYDFAVNQWEEAAEMNEPRYGATSFEKEDSLHILGGRDSIHVLDSTLIYKNGEIQNGKTLPYPAWYACAVRVNATHVFWAGGNDGSRYHSDAYLLEIASWTWTKLDDMKHQRNRHSCGRMGNMIVVVGGYSGDDGESSFSCTICFRVFYGIDHSGNWHFGLGFKLISSPMGVFKKLSL